MADEREIVVVHDPGGIGFSIDRMWAFLAVGDDGDEGVVATSGAMPGVMLPLVAADQERLGALRPVAAEIAKMTGRAIRLVRFDQRTEVEVFGP